jgi:hypothetical protein
MRYLRICLVFAFIALLAFSKVQAQERERVASIVYKDLQTRQLLTLPKSISGPFATDSFKRVQEAGFESEWCKSFTLTYWSNSRHPGYSAKAHLHTNQDQDGIGFKCRRGGDHPTFFSVDTMINSQYGSTIAFSVGKQLDLINWHGIKYYRGMSLTALTYERPAYHDMIAGVVPIQHRGVSVDIRELFGVPLPKKFKGTFGWEELTLPVDKIRVRSWGAELRMEF